MTADRLPDLDALEREARQANDRGDSLGDDILALIQRVRQLERVREAARAIPICNDCMNAGVDDELNAALAAAEEPTEFDWSLIDDQALNAGDQ